MSPTDPRQEGLPAPPPTAPPDAVRAAIKARVLAASLGGQAPAPKLDGRYRLIREIGRGGSGTVWEAELEPLRRRVAVKLLRASNGGQGAQRLLREAMNASKIGHPHIVSVHDVGTDERGAPYLVMDLLEGESLAELIKRRGSLPWPEVQVIAEQICAALGAAHEAGVVHRDIKPANVFVRRDADGRWHSTLLDFGLCKETDGGTALTEEGTLLGTPGYMAPEQIGADAVDLRADLYAVACVVVELVTGAQVFSGTRQEILAAQLQGEHVPVPASIPVRARRALEQALSVDPNARPQSATELRAAIQATSLDRTVPAAPTGERAAVGRGYILGVVTTVAFLTGIFLVQRRDDAVEDVPSAAVEEPASAVVVEEPAIEDVASTPEPAKEPAKAEPSPAVAPIESTDEPEELVAGPPRDKPRPRKPRSRTPRPQPGPEPAPKPEPKPKPKPKPERRELVDGIRDPFAH